MIWSSLLVVSDVQQYVKSCFGRKITKTILQIFLVEEIYCSFDTDYCNSINSNAIK